MAESGAPSSTGRSASTSAVLPKAVSLLPSLDFLDVSQLVRRKNTQGESGGQSPVEPASPSQLLASPASYVLLKQQNKNDELRRYFSLPPGEALLDDFYCALRKHVLLQGRMYVFEHYICFYCSVFGFVKKKTLPLSEVVAVRKKTHLRIPNSIEIEMASGAKEFFTSFISREDAYKLISVTWQETTASTCDGVSGQGTTSSHAQNGRQPAGSNEGSTASAAEVAAEQVAAELLESEANRLRRAVCRKRPKHTSQRLAHQASSSTSATADASTAEVGNGQAASGRRSESPCQPGDDDDETHDSEEEDSALLSAPVAPVPPLLHDHQLIITTTLPGTVREVFTCIWGNNSHVLEDCYESRGARRINISSWRAHEQLGHVRDLQFTSPIPGAFASTWGTSHTKCFQSQRFVVCEGEHVVVETSQTMADIPYGDYFTVDSRWDLKRNPLPTASPDDAVLVTVHVRVPFHKKCMFKRMIEGSSKKQYQEGALQLLDMARECAALEASAAGAAGEAGPGLQEVPSGGPPTFDARFRRSLSQPHLVNISSLDAGVGSGGPGATGGGRHRRSVSQASELSARPGGPTPKAFCSGRSFSEPGSDGGAMAVIFGAVFGGLWAGARRVGGVLGHWADVLVGNAHASPRMAALIILVSMMLLVQLLSCFCWLLGTRWAAGARPSGVGAGPWGAGDADYWPARLEQLQAELLLLQRRLAQVGDEVAFAAQAVAAAPAAARRAAGA